MARQLLKHIMRIYPYECFNVSHAKNIGKAKIVFASQMNEAGVS